MIYTLESLKQEYQNGNYYKFLFFWGHTPPADGSKAKFSQNQDLLQFLLDTKNRILVEASPRDRIWGIGMGKNNPDAEDPMKWRGKNRLGFALTEVRDEMIGEMKQR